jgi:APA family basic amino acid/polyamine antiporter
MSSEPTPSSGAALRTITLFTATCIVVANMVGTGVFTSLGFQVGPLPSGFAILMLWLVGGICAICGAMAYGELAAALPRSGGEYNFLSVIYHPAIGFMAGWISITVGFAAPVAVAAMAFARYFQTAFPGIGGDLLGKVLAVALVVIVTGFHLCGTRAGSRFQNWSTVLKLILIVGMIAAGLFAGHAQPISFLPQAGDGSLITSAGFAVSLFWVMFAYSGWNASVYVAGEVRNPARNIPLSNLIGAVGVMVLYVLLNAAMLRAAPIASLNGNVEVTAVAATSLFGGIGGRVVSALICAGLVATVSSMVFIGPRVSMAMGQDWAVFQPLARTSHRGVPATAMFAQGVITVLLVLIAKYDQVNSFLTFALSLCSCLAVLGVYVLRWRRPEIPRPVKAWGYPVTPAIFLAVNLWMLWYLLWQRSLESLSSLGVMAAGLVLYWAGPRAKNVPAATERDTIVES